MNGVNFRLSFILAFFLFSLLALPHCTPDTEILRDYPLVKTLPADSVTTEGAVFYGIIIGSPEDVNEYGFVWGNSIILNIRESERVFQAGVPGDLAFSMAVSGQFEPSRTYYVCSYIRSGELIIYGNTLQFSIDAGLNP